MYDVGLEINDMRYNGWKTVRISRGIEQIAGTFELGVSERWPGERGENTGWPINPGDSCKVVAIHSGFEDDKVIINGYVDDVTRSLSKDSHEVTVSGRDKTGNLVDCSAINGSGEWKKCTILKIAEDLCKPFGITVSAIECGDRFREWSIQESETCYECLERAARMQGLMLISDGDGGLLITRPVPNRFFKEKITRSLVEGVNILSASMTTSWRDRFKKYIVKGQNCGDDWTTPEQNAEPVGESIDKNVSIYRPLIVLAEDLVDVAGCKKRARWENTVRAGKAERINITVQGWDHSGIFWEPNKLVRVLSSSLRLDKDLLIVAVSFFLDEGGSRTELTLCDENAFNLIALTESTD